MASPDLDAAHVSYDASDFAVGVRVTKLFEDGNYYDGTVTAMDEPGRYPYSVTFDDGDVESYTLKQLVKQCQVIATKKNKALKPSAVNVKDEKRTSLGKRKGKAPAHDTNDDNGDDDEQQEQLNPAGAKAAKNKYGEKVPIAQREALEKHDDAMKNAAKAYRKEAKTLIAEKRDEVAKGLSKAEIDKLVGDVARYVLMKHHNTGGVPIPRADLTNIVNKAYSKRTGLANYVIAMAQAKLADAFGFECAEVVRPAKGSAGAGAAAAVAQQKAASKAKGKAKQGDKDGDNASGAGTSAAAGGTRYYVLRSILPVALRGVVDRFNPDEKALARRGFAIAVIALVRAAERLTEDALWSHLATMGVSRTSLHPQIGDPEAEVSKLVKMRYLSRDRSLDGGPNGEEAYVYELAEVSHYELTADGVDGLLAHMATFGENQV